MLGELLLRPFAPLLQKTATILAGKGIKPNYLLFALWGLTVLILAAFVMQFYTSGAVLLALFVMVNAVRNIGKVATVSGVDKPAPVYVALAAVCLFLIGLGYNADYMTPVCFLLLTWLLWLLAHFAFSSFKTFVGSGEMVLAVVAMAIWPVYVPVVTIFVGVLYIVVTGIAIAQQFLKANTA